MKLAYEVRECKKAHWSPLRRRGEERRVRAGRGSYLSSLRGPCTLLNVYIHTGTPWCHRQTGCCPAARARCDRFRLPRALLTRRFIKCGSDAGHRLGLNGERGGALHDSSIVSCTSSQVVSISLLPNRTEPTDRPTDRLRVLLPGWCKLPQFLHRRALRHKHGRDSAAWSHDPEVRAWVWKYSRSPRDRDTAHGWSHETPSLKE